MSAVLLAVYTSHEAAERARTDLVRDGFPTDRVELTDCSEPGRAGLVPCESLHGKFTQYFQTLLNLDGERHYPELLAETLEKGGATVTVHPRGVIETARATEILEGIGVKDLVKHDLTNQKLEHAAARRDSPWISNFWVEHVDGSHCIYCQLFERDTS